MVGCGWNAGVSTVGRAPPVLEILIGSAAPMTPGDAHAQLKVRYPGTPVPYATVKSGLAEEVVRPSSRIQRDGRGMYRAVA